MLHLEVPFGPPLIIAPSLPTPQSSERNLPARPVTHQELFVP